jgi:hypothetical protein
VSTERLRVRLWRAMFPSPAVGTPERVSVVDLKPGTRVKLLGQVYEVDLVVRTFANERDVVLRQIGGPNRLELAELEYPFATFELASEVDES